MKAFTRLLLSLCLLFSLTACSGAPDLPLIDDVDIVGGEDVGGDWHAWGVYDFTYVGDMSVAIDQVNNEDSQHIGYDIYRDGESLGALLSEIRCTDGGYLPEDMDPQDFLLFEDHNGDGLEDIGAPLKCGDVMWYCQTQNEYGETSFPFTETQKADTAPQNAP